MNPGWQRGPIRVSSTCFESLDSFSKAGLLPREFRPRTYLYQLGNKDNLENVDIALLTRSRRKYVAQNGNLTNGKYQKNEQQTS
jgi:hypothetical protein